MTSEKKARLTPVELAKAVSETLINRPDKGIAFKSFCNEMKRQNVDSLDIIIKHINNYQDSILDQEYDRLKAELMTLESKRAARK